MNKEQAIGWVNANLRMWPKMARGPEAPQGWRWVISQLPYMRPKILLHCTEKTDGEITVIEQSETELK